jgi:hypothetical protein
MMSHSITIAPENSLIGISDIQKPNGGIPDAPLPDGITATEFDILVACYPEVEGETKITLGQASDVDPGYAPAFDGQLVTPGRVVRITDVGWKPLLETPVSSQNTRIRIWKNNVRFADEIIVGVE